MTTVREAFDDLMDAGPGALCGECGHMAGRHGDMFCDGFPDRPCSCKGLLWQGVRIPIICGRPILETARLDVPETPSPGYHNTNGEQGPELACSQSTAAQQEAKVESFFREHPHEWFRPEDVHEQVLPSAPIQSARRAVSNLTKSFVLQKSTLDGRRMGNHGKLVYTWRLGPWKLVE